MNHCWKARSLHQACAYVYKQGDTSPLSQLYVFPLGCALLHTDQRPSSTALETGQSGDDQARLREQLFGLVDDTEVLDTHSTSAGPSSPAFQHLAQRGRENLIRHHARQDGLGSIPRRDIVGKSPMVP